MKVIFLSLSDPDVAIARVAARVAQGGHNVPESAIRRRFVAGLNNFYRIYRDLADAWALYDNSGPVPLLLEWNESQ